MRRRNVGDATGYDGTFVLAPLWSVDGRGTTVRRTLSTVDEADNVCERRPLIASTAGERPRTLFGRTNEHLVLFRLSFNGQIQMAP